jgi:hypothetical protein
VVLYPLRRYGLRLALVLLAYSLGPWCLLLPWRFLVHPVAEVVEATGIEMVVMGKR